MPLDCKMIDQMTFFPLYCPSRKPAVCVRCANSSDGIQQPRDARGANAAHLKFVMPLAGPLERRAGIRHTLSPQVFAAVGASCVPAALHSVPDTKLPVPRWLHGGGRIAAGQSSSRHPASFGRPLPFPSLQWDEAEGIRSREKTPQVSQAAPFPPWGEQHRGAWLLTRQS